MHAGRDHMDISEVLRYAGVSTDADESLRQRAEQIAQELCNAISPKWVWRVLPSIDLPGQTAQTMLADCHSVCILVCTLGAAFDARLRAMQARDMSDALLLNAAGSALVEEGCDAAQREIAARFPQAFLTDRFSPGYGDLPLTVQPMLCELTDAQRRLGVHVTDTFLLNPVKTVTAVIGLSDRPQKARIRGCAYCGLRDTCSLRKGGKRCAL
ncbi:MAG: methionine synthase [Clostridia bacterium]|nr:methionine synthase [Clostridia bacterium]